MKQVKLFITYLKNHQEINRNLSYAIKNGYAFNEDMGIIERTDYWLRCLDYDPEE